LEESLLVSDIYVGNSVDMHWLTRQ